MGIDTETSGPGQQAQPWQAHLEALVLALFTVEVVVKLLAEDKEPWRYFQDHWNKYSPSIRMISFALFF